MDNCSIFLHPGYCACECMLIDGTEHQDPGKMDSFQFGYDMSYSLVLPRIQQRPRIGLNSTILRKIVMVTGEEIKETPQVPIEGLTHPPIAQEAKKCKVCLANTQGSEQKVKKDKMMDQMYLVRFLSMCQVCT